jgi:heme/copper-type cytochrome/quinol oxidase subunit 2
MRFLILILVIGVLVISGCSDNAVSDNNVDIPSENDQSDNVIDNGDSVPDSVGGSDSGNVKEFNIVARQWEFDPSVIEVNQGDRVILHIESVDVTHGFGLPEFNINEELRPGETVDVEFVADKKGSFTFSCTVYCGSGHGSMKGTLIVN